MNLEQISSVLAVVVLFSLRLAVPVGLTWMLGQLLRRVAPQAS